MKNFRNVYVSWIIFFPFLLIFFSCDLRNGKGATKLVSFDLHHNGRPIKTPSASLASTTLSKDDLNCFAIFIQYPDGGGATTCQVNGGTNISFDQSGGPTVLPGNLSMELKVSGKVRVMVVAYNSTDKSCLPFVERPPGKAPNSDAFLIANAVYDITSSTNKIEVNGQLVPDNWLVQCSGDLLNFEKTDTTPPTAGSSGLLATSTATVNSMTLNWTQGTDDEDTVAQLSYLAYYSTSTQMDTVTQIEANGTPVDAYATNIQSKLISNLQANTSYTLNVIVKDSAGNKTPYSKVTQTTQADSSVPTPGASGVLSASSVAFTSLVLNWSAGTDNADTSSNLEYLPYYSTSSLMDSVAQIEANGTAVGSLTKNLLSKSVTGLLTNTSYFFNVIIKDSSGNKAAYTKLAQATQADTSAPSPGASGGLSVSSVSFTSLLLGWTGGTDNADLAADLFYRPYYSTSTIMDTVAQIEANGTPVGSFTKNLLSNSITGLLPNTSYFLNVIVKDSSGNKAAYSKAGQTTAADTVAPTPGASGALTNSNVTPTSLTLNWTAASDNVDPSSQLLYLPYYSTSTQMDTVTQIESNGTAAGSYTQDIQTKSLTGLLANTTYSLNVIVKDTSGNKAAYAKTSQLTLNCFPLASCGPSLNLISTNITRTEIAGLNGTSGDGSTGNWDGVGTAARFNIPDRMATDGTYIYVADSEFSTIRKIEPVSKTVTTLAGTPTYPGSLVNGTGSAARFNSPVDIAYDGQYLYVADMGNHVIRRIDPTTAVVTTFVGTGSPGSTDGTSNQSFNSPRGITSDGLNLYIADTGNNKIRKVVISTKDVSTFAGSGGAGDTDGTGTAATISAPTSITSDGTNLYVVQQSTQIIRKIVIATGVVTLYAGASGSSGAIDATRLSARFNNPRGIACDGSDLYIAEHGNDRVRRINLGTDMVSTVIGTTGCSTFCHAYGLVILNGGLFVSSNFSHTISKLAPTVNVKSQQASQVAEVFAE